MLPWAEHRRRRSGFTLFEAVISVALLAVLAAVIMPSIASSRTTGDTERIDHVVLVLDQIRDGMARFNLGTRGDTSYTAKIGGAINRGGTYPSRLSMLTNKIATTGNFSLNSCGYAVTSANVTAWSKNFYIQPMTFNGTLKIADGFIANDLMERYTPAGGTTLPAINDVTTAGTLAIVIPNVTIDDARALSARMEGVQDPTSTNAVVRYTISGSNPVTVRYHIGIHGC